MAPRGWTTVCYSCWSENGNSKSSKLLLSWGITICVPFPQSDSPLGSTGDYWSYSTPFQVNCAWNEVHTLEHTFVWKVVIYFYLAGCWYLGNRKNKFSLFLLSSYFFFKPVQELWLVCFNMSIPEMYLKFFVARLHL